MMKNINYTVVYEPRVLDALTEISVYYAEKGGQELANKMLDNIISQLDKLEFMPYRCQATDFCEHIRKMVIKKPPYLAYYTVVKTQVRILELIHSYQEQDLIYQKYKDFNLS